METKIKLCTKCEYLKTDNKILKNFGKWHFSNPLLFKDKIYMEKCQNCKTILVWKQHLYPDRTAGQFIKYLSLDDVDYLIWELKKG